MDATAADESVGSAGAVGACTWTPNCSDNLMDVSGEWRSLKSVIFQTNLEDSTAGPCTSLFSGIHCTHRWGLWNANLAVPAQEFMKHKFKLIE